MTSAAGRLRLADKVVVITGSGSGLGRESALLFSAEGATIVTSDKVPGRAEAVAKEVEAAGGTATAVDADVRSEADMQRLVDAAVDAYGRIDVMWANAGVPEPGFGMKSFADSETDDWNDIFAVNVTGIYLAWKHAARWMIANKHAPAALLATTSASAFNAYPGFPMYTASKAAANGLVRAAALELGKFGIRVNALAPDPWDVGELRAAAGGGGARQVLRRDGAVGPREPRDAIASGSPADHPRQCQPRAVPGVRRSGVHVWPGHPVG